MRLFSISLVMLALFLGGCSAMNAEKKDPAGMADPEADTSSSGKSAKTDESSGDQSNNNGGGNIQVMTGGAGAAGVTPVSGGENLGGGGGGGTGMAAKDAARGAVTKASGSTAGSVDMGAADPGQ